MVKCKKFELTEPLELNYDSLYVIPANNSEYTALFGDTQYTFSAEEIEEMCDKINAIGCTSFQLSKEELVKMIKELDLRGSNNIEYNR